MHANFAKVFGVTSYPGQFAKKELPHKLLVGCTTGDVFTYAECVVPAASWLGL